MLAPETTTVSIMNNRTTFMSPTHLRLISRKLSLWGGALTLIFSATLAIADEYSDIAKLMKASQMAEAITKADQFLATKPRDPQMRFLKGVMQSEMGKSNDAINTFVKLTEEYPELPEPYNNLAVLYANAGQFDKARNSLEMAIRTNPSYSTAHENLGDIYARLASQAYAKALQLDTTNTAVSPKLALIRELFTPTAGRLSATKPTPTGSTPPPTTPTASSAPAAVAPVVAPLGPKQPTVVTASPTGSTQPSVAPASVNNALVSRDITAAAEAWAKAWSDRDMKSYLASYGKDFTPPNKLTRAAWEEERKARIMGKAKISVKLFNITTAVSGNTASVKFKQDYKADALATSSRKTLEMVKQGERWVITKEIAG
jgi:Flp pilus assembly protein TadD/ketosteroid isomerase-like protein